MRRDPLVVVIDADLELVKAAGWSGIRFNDVCRLFSYGVCWCHEMYTDANWYDCQRSISVVNVWKKLSLPEASTTRSPSVP